MPDTASPRAADTATPAPAPTKTGGKGGNPGNARRQQLLTWVGIAVILGAVGYGAYYTMYASHFVETDNAYVGTDTAQVNALVSGPVASINAKETQTVHAGDVLLTIDDSDAKIAVEQAQAALALAERHVQGYQATDLALAGQVGASEANIARATAQIAAAQSDLDTAKTNFTRRQNLANTGAVSAEELTDAQDAYSKAQAAYTTAVANRDAAVATAKTSSGQRETNSTLFAGVTADQNPEVLAAKAKLDAAQLALDRTVVKAPTDGIVSKKSVEVGQQVGIGTPLMTVVPVNQAYIDANFKEVQLKDVHPGQKAEITTDLYGKKVVYHGVVRGISGGTGSAFSLIPAQNASGNWIKVVQRLPVRIDLDPAELKSHPLRVGLSSTVKIDVK